MCFIVQYFMMHFFHKILYNEAHLLHMYLPDRSQIVYTLRNRNHNKILIPKTSDLNERHFLIRVLYKHCYWLYSVLHTPFSCVSVMWSCVWQLFIKEFYDDDTAVSLQVALCHPPGSKLPLLLLPFQPNSLTTHRPSYIPAFAGKLSD